MTRDDLYELISGGEDSRLEFKRDGLPNQELAKIP